MLEDIDLEEIELERPIRKPKSVPVMETYKVLQEVDHIMRHNPKWKPTDWAYVFSSKSRNYFNADQRKKMANGRTFKPGMN